MPCAKIIGTRWASFGEISVRIYPAICLIRVVLVRTWIFSGIRTERRCYGGMGFIWWMKILAFVYIHKPTELGHERNRFCFFAIKNSINKSFSVSGFNSVAGDRIWDLLSNNVWNGAPFLLINCLIKRHFRGTRISVNYRNATLLDSFAYSGMWSLVINGRVYLVSHFNCLFAVTWTTDFARLINNPLLGDNTCHTENN